MQGFEKENLGPVPLCCVVGRIVSEWYLDSGGRRMVELPRIEAEVMRFEMRFTAAISHEETDA